VLGAGEDQAVAFMDKNRVAMVAAVLVLKIIIKFQVIQFQR
jgi:hypothetical protein